MSLRISQEIDIQEVYWELTPSDKRELASMLADEEIFIEPNRPSFDLSDPIVRLGVITELRKIGFTVEPTSAG